MRGWAELSFIVVLVGCIAAFTVLSVMAAIAASVGVARIAAGGDDNPYAVDFATCDRFQPVVCDDVLEGYAPPSPRHTIVTANGDDLSRECGGEPTGPACETTSELPQIAAPPSSATPEAEPALGG